MSVSRPEVRTGRRLHENHPGSTQGGVRRARLLMTYRGDPDEFDRDLRQTTDLQLSGDYSSLGPQHKCRYVRFLT